MMGGLILTTFPGHAQWLSSNQMVSEQCIRVLRSLVQSSYECLVSLIHYAVRGKFLV